MKQILFTLMIVLAMAGCSGTTWNIIDSFNNNLIAENRYQMILDGLQVSLLITFCAAIQQAYSLVKEMLFTHMRTIRPLTLRMTHAELSRVTALDFMVEHLDHSPLDDAARESLRPQVKELIEEPTTRGFRVKLII